MVCAALFVKGLIDASFFFSNADCTLLFNAACVLFVLFFNAEAQSREDFGVFGDLGDF